MFEFYIYTRILIYLYLILYTHKIINFSHISEEIEKREKALDEELNVIEVQVGLSKQSQNFEASTSLHAVEAPRSIEEGEENRDPNPEHNEDTINNDVDVSMQSIMNETFDDNQDVEKKDEVQLDQVQNPPDENNG